MPNHVRTTRLAQGLCVHCGADAAPYSLCESCRFRSLLRRICNRAFERGLVTKEKRGRENFYQSKGVPFPAEGIYHEAQAGDNRLHPRLRHIPVDIEHALIQLFVQDGLGMLTEEEIVQAWGKLRLRPGRRSAALDMAAIIRAERKRQAKNIKRAQAITMAGKE